MANKIIHLFTAQYPYGNKSEPFLETEIRHLAKHFEIVYIYPSSKAVGVRIMPENCIIRDVLNETKLNRYSKFSLLLKRKSTISSLLRLEQKSKGVNVILSCLKLFLDILANQLHKFDLLNSSGYFNNEDLYYDYWYTNSTVALALGKKENLISHFVSRAHGYDLFDERWPISQIPFRQFIYNYIDNIYFISKNGMNYFRHKINNPIPFKGSLAYLGVDKQLQTPSKKTERKTLTSCSSLLELKNVAAIPHILNNINLSIRWHHIGDGPERKNVEQVAATLPNNINYTLFGHLEHNDVINYYKHTYVDGFISLSESEGLPVSMMEAISFGIPILARNIGGISEIVNETTGIIINSNDDPAQKLSEFLNKKWDRQAIIVYQHEHFDSMKNYDKFISSLCKGE